MKTFLDWSTYDTYGIGDAYSGIPATSGNYARTVAVCMHSRDCQNQGKGVMRPSFRITGDRVHSTWRVLLRSRPRSSANMATLSHCRKTGSVAKVGLLF